MNNSTRLIAVGDKFNYGPLVGVISETTGPESVILHLPGGKKELPVKELDSRVYSRRTLKINQNLSELLQKFIPVNQFQVILDLLRSEEASFFGDKLCEVESIILGMPPIYGQDGKGDEAIAYLHYFAGGCDWYITEKDVDDPYCEHPIITEQYQAFGLARLNGNTQNAEVGYIPITELIKIGAVELDLHWTPKPLGIIRKAFDL